MTETLVHRKLGSTGLTVSPIGLGTVKFGRNEGVKYPQGFDLPADGDLLALLETARHLGINFLDTAPAYGVSEARLGKLLSQVPGDWLVATKVGEQFQGGVSHYDFSAEATRRSIETSLERLKRDQLDLVLVHSNGDDQNVVCHTPVIETLADLKASGLIRAIGFSGKDPEGSLKALDLVDVFMITLNPADLSQAAVIAACKRENKGVVIKKALMSGHAESAAEALKFSLTYPGVSSVVVGTINPGHLKANAAIAMATTVG